MRPVGNVDRISSSIETPSFADAAMQRLYKSHTASNLDGPLTDRLLFSDADALPLHNIELLSATDCCRNLVVLISAHGSYVLLATISCPTA
jgi:hypothetical protein